MNVGRDQMTSLHWSPSFVVEGPSGRLLLLLFVSGFDVSVTPELFVGAASPITPPTAPRRRSFAYSLFARSKEFTATATLPLATSGVALSTRDDSTTPLTISRRSSDAEGAVTVAPATVVASSTTTIQSSRRQFGFYNYLLMLSSD
jgi:hypothetical protein